MKIQSKNILRRSVASPLLLCLPLLASTPAMAAQGAPPGPAWRGISELPVVISDAGPYFLESGLSTTEPIAIHARVSDVVINLNGFCLDGADFAAKTGVLIEAGLRNIVITNGTIKGFGEAGINGQGAAGGVLRDLVLVGNSSGALLGSSYSIRDCLFLDNTRDGLVCEQSCSIEHCISLENARNGFQVGKESTLRDCLASRNAQVGFESSSGHVLIHGCRSSGNSEHGFLAGSSSLVEGCVATENGEAGIGVVGNAVVLGNMCSSNGIGLRIGGTDGRIEGNHCAFNDIVVTGLRNLIIDNSVSFGSYSIASTNMAGPILTQFELATDTNPHVNYRFQ